MPVSDSNPTRDFVKEMIFADETFKKMTTFSPIFIRKSQRSSANSRGRPKQPHKYYC